MSDSCEVRLDAAVRELRRVSDRSAAVTAIDEIAGLAAKGFGPALPHLLAATLRFGLAEQPVRSILLDTADVDDAVQATLIVVADKISSFEGRARFDTWVDRVARNEALQLLRRKGRKTEPATNEVPEQDITARRLSSLIADEDSIAAAFADLSDEHRQVIRLRENDGYSYEEISERLGLPVGTVRSRLSRARSVLAELLLDPFIMGHPP